MGMKRKRNELDDSPGSSVSTASSVRPSSPSPTPRHTQTFEMVDAPYVSLQPSAWQPEAPTEAFYEPSRPMLNSRTRKRWRDNRPDIDTIHANTLQKLFEAQRQDNRGPHALQEPQPTTMSQEHSAIQPRPQTSLHAFWNISVPPPPSLHESVPNDTPGGSQTGRTLASTGPERCEDCDAVVTSDDMMEWDGIGRASSSHGVCQNCGKRLCDACAVVKNARLCIQCA